MASPQSPSSIPALTSASKIVSLELGKSSKTKAAFAARKLSYFANTYGMDDFIKVTPRSSDLLINLLHKYSGMTKENPDHKSLLGREWVNGMINGPRRVYRNASHTEFWSVRTIKGETTASGNPLDGNPMINEFCKSHAKKLSVLGKVIRSAPPPSPEIIIEHFREYLTPPPTHQYVHPVDV